MKNRYHWVLVFVVAGLLLMGPAAAATLEQQRQAFLKAQQHLRAGNINDFKKLSAQLAGYPLHPYLLYDYLSANLKKVKDRDIADFLKHHSDLPVADDLRRDWLRLLAKRGRWQGYVDNYTPQANSVLQCLHLQARFNTGYHAGLLEDTRDIWLSGESLPPQCDPAFARLYKSKLMTNDLIWNRIRLAMAKSNISMTKNLSKRLIETDKKWIARWIAMHHNPLKWSNHPVYADLPIAHEILLHGIGRLARKDIDTAIARWEALKSAYGFPRKQINHIERTLAIKAASNKHARAKELLGKVNGKRNDEYLFHWRLFTVLQDSDWPTLMKWTAGAPPSGLLRLRWLYWRARALEEMGDIAAADRIFKSLATEREYYGFLAADRMGMEYTMNHQTLVEGQYSRNEIENLPAVVRARELYHLGLAYPARREWNHVFRGLDNRQMQIAAAIASQWGWHDRTIVTLGKARAFDDLILRFPLAYEEQLRENIEKSDLDLSWVYALTRAESAFMEDARSHSGALGLMQVMPQTGKQTAKSIGLKKFHAHHLLQARHNISIGTSYLKQMYQRFDNNLILATAAYNAGPTNVKRWLPEEKCVDPEIWLETIPFNETRKYVRRILFYASVYDWRLQQGITPVKGRMTVVSPDTKELIVHNSCPGQLLSLH